MGVITRHAHPAQTKRTHPDVYHFSEVDSCHGIFNGVGEFFATLVWGARPTTQLFRG